MSDLWDNRDMMDDAKRMPAFGHVTGFSENWLAQWETSWRTNMFISEDLAQDEAYNELFEQATRVGAASRTVDTAAQLHLYGTPPFRENLLKQVSEWKKKNPDHPYASALPGSKEEFDMRIKTRAQRAVQVSEDVYSRAGTAGTIASFGADFAASAIDPPNLLSSMVGAPAAVGILKGVLIEAGIGMLSEAAQQPQIQGYRRELGLPENAMERILTAGLGAGGLYAGIRFTGMGIRGLTRLFRDEVKNPTPLQRAAADMLDRMDEIKRDSPFDPTAKGAPEYHQIKFDEAYEAVKAGRLPIGDEPAPLRAYTGAASARPRFDSETALGRLDFMETMGIEIPGVDWNALRRMTDTVGKVVDNNTSTPVARADGTVARFMTEDDAKDYLKKLRKRNPGVQYEAVKTAENNWIATRKTQTEIIRDGNGRPVTFPTARSAQKHIDRVLNGQKAITIVPVGEVGSRRYALARGATEEDVRHITAAPEHVNWRDPLAERSERGLPPDAQDVLRAHARSEFSKLDNYEHSSKLTQDIQTAKVKDEQLKELETKQEALVKAAMATVEQMVNEIGDFNVRLDYADANGNVYNKSVSTKELLDDIKDDENLIKEFEACLGAAAVK